MKFAYAKIALVAAVLGTFAADASAQGRGRRGVNWNNVVSWYYPAVNSGWYSPSSYSNWGYPGTYNSSWYGRGGNRTYYTPNYWYSTPTYSYYSPLVYSYTTPGTVVTSDPRKSLLNVIVPTADAQLWLNGTLMSSQGFERNFSSPPLETGVNYTYSVKVQWMMDGKPVEQIRDVTVRAGQRSSVDFRTSPGQTAPQPVPQSSK
jgi:uncharacterized protein (TIGR03000 family)